jgi:hypothetical protein
MICPIESEADSSVNSGFCYAERGNEFGKRNQAEDIDDQGRSACTKLPVWRRPVGPFARHREQAEFPILKAQGLNPADLANLQNGEPPAAQGMKRMDDLDRSQRLVG